MKRRLVLVVFTFALCILLSGCGNKEEKLVCKQSTSGVDIALNTMFKGNVVESMDFSYEMDLSQYSDIQIEAIKSQDFCEIVKTSMKASGFIIENCNQNISNKKLVANADIDITEISKADKTGSPEKTKKELETQGYTCVIEK